MKHNLHPALKRLMKWSQSDSPQQSEEAPFGFSSRVIASLELRGQAPTLLLQLQQSAWSFVSVSVVILICGTIILASQLSKPKPAVDVSSALSFLASNLPQ